MKQFITCNSTDKIIFELKARDERLAALIAFIGGYSLTLRTDFFASLVRIITGQQLSVNAARVIFERVSEACDGEIKPQTIVSLDEETLRTAGLSKPKIVYLKDLAQKVLNDEINFAEIESLTDSEIIEVLTTVKGIGRWSAEMFLIFSLGRQDVFAVDDIGLQRSVKWLYGLDSSSGKGEIEMLSQGWRPYRSVASLYLWEVINRGLIKKNDSEAVLGKDDRSR